MAIGAKTETCNGVGDLSTEGSASVSAPLLATAVFATHLTSVTSRRNYPPRCEDRAASKMLTVLDIK